jgi:ubiquitin C-terminal hydrolase
LTESFKILIDAIWPEEGRQKELKNKHYEPYDFKNKISAMDPLFKSYSAKDAKDLVNFIVMTLHTELNKEDDKNSNNIINYANIDQRNQIQTFSIFLTDFKNNFRSFISDIFYAIQQTQTQCLKCKTIQYNFQTYFFLIFPLEEVKKYTINKIYNETNFNNMNNIMNNNMNMNMNMNYNNYNMSNNMNNNYNMNMNFYGNMNNLGNNIINNMQNLVNTINNNRNFCMNSNQNNFQKLEKLNKDIVHIFDCFDYNQKLDTFTGNNAMFCNYCGQITESNYCTTLLTLPKVLIILLNRGKGIEFKIKLEFTEILDLNQYAELKDSNDHNNSNKYKLIGVITHLGNSGEDGHFIAHCLSPIDNQWYTYNDAIVTQKSNFKEIIDFGMPYLLFYHKIDDNYN